MNRLLAQAVGGRASDLHLTVGTPPLLRIHGEIQVMKGAPLEAAQLESLIRGLMNEEQCRQFDAEHEICFSLDLPDIGYFRVTVYRQRGCVEASIRLGIPEMQPITELGLPLEVEELSRKANGLVLITGPTGHGKTTTLNSLIDHVNRERRCKIVMIEDPIEFRHRNIQSVVVQQEVGTDTLSFHRALIHVLRQDPDVIAVGELRDLDTIEAALTAAETGHLVIATLHSNDCAQTVSRIVDVFPEDRQSQVRFQLSATLQGILSQRLLPRSDEPGRVLAHGLLLGNPAIRNLIRENKVSQIDNVIVAGRREGMVSQDDTVRDLYKRAVISYDTALTAVSDPKVLHDGAGGRQPS